MQRANLGLNAYVAIQLREALFCPERTAPIPASVHLHWSPRFKSLMVTFYLSQGDFPLSSQTHRMEEKEWMELVKKNEASFKEQFQFGEVQRIQLGFRDFLRALYTEKISTLDERGLHFFFRTAGDYAEAMRRNPLEGSPFQAVVQNGEAFAGSVFFILRQRARTAMAEIKDLVKKREQIESDIGDHVLAVYEADDSLTACGLYPVEIPTEIAHVFKRP